jgi:hypothetical protein
MFSWSSPTRQKRGTCTDKCAQTSSEGDSCDDHGKAHKSTTVENNSLWAMSTKWTEQLITT